MNNCTFIGRMTKEPEVKTVSLNGVATKVINFRIAVDDNFGQYKKTDFIAVTAWRGAAEAIGEYMTKGRQIAVKGAVHLETYTKDGKTYATLAMPRPDGFEFLGKRVVNDVPEDAPAPEAVAEELPWDE